MPCSHVFGLGCIVQWLAEGVEFRRQCPMCRRSVLFGDDRAGEGGEVGVGRVALLRDRGGMDGMRSQRMGRGGGASGRRRWGC